MGLKNKISFFGIEPQTEWAVPDKKVLEDTHSQDGMGNLQRGAEKQSDHLACVMKKEIRQVPLCKMSVTIVQSNYP